MSEKRFDAIAIAIELCLACGLVIASWMIVYPLLVGIPTP